MSMADLIATRRKEKGMTQKQLGSKLGVTDKVVSKWERGNGQPDINFLEPLAEALEVTISELLKGKRENHTNMSDNKQNIDEILVRETLDYASSVHKARSKNIPRIMMLSLLAVGLAGIITTSIVDFALNGGFTWSLLPISAMIYSWLCIMPLFFFGKRSVNIALLSASVFIFPFLYVLCKWSGGNWFASVAIPVAISGIGILWLIRIVFGTKRNIWYKLAISVFIGAGGNFFISCMLGTILSDGGFDIWSLTTIAILVVIAIVLLVISQTRKSN